MVNKKCTKQKINFKNKATFAPKQILNLKKKR